MTRTSPTSPAAAALQPAHPHSPRRVRLILGVAFAVLCVFALVVSLAVSAPAPRRGYGADAAALIDWLSPMLAWIFGAAAVISVAAAGAKYWLLGLIGLIGMIAAEGGLIGQEAWDGWVAGAISPLGLGLALGAFSIAIARGNPAGDKKNPLAAPTDATPPGRKAREA